VPSGANSGVGLNVDVDCTCTELKKFITVAHPRFSAAECYDAQKRSAQGKIEKGDGKNCRTISHIASFFVEHWNR